MDSDHVMINGDDDVARARLIEVLRRRGFVTFEGFDDAPRLLGLAKTIMRVWPHRDSGPDGITAIHDRGVDAQASGYAGFSSDQLMVHSDGATQARPPALVMLMCARDSLSGGESLLVDGSRLHESLAAQEPRLLEDLKQPRSINIGGSTGYTGPVFTRRGDRMIVRFRFDDLVEFSPAVSSRLDQLRAALSESMLRIRLQRGQGYLLSNTRWLHGRTAFVGDRLMYRLIGDPVPDLELAEGFAAPLPA